MSRFEKGCGRLLLEMWCLLSTSTAMIFGCSSSGGPRECSCVRTLMMTYEPTVKCVRSFRLVVEMDGERHTCASYPAGSSGEVWCDYEGNGPLLRDRSTTPGCTEVRDMLGPGGAQDDG